jgi:hypothetical protein
MTTHKRGVDARCNIHFVDSLSLPLSLSLSLLASVYFLVLVLVHVHVHVHVLVLVHVSVDDQTPLCAFAEMKYIWARLSVCSCNQTPIIHTYLLLWRKRIP